MQRNWLRCGGNQKTVWPGGRVSLSRVASDRLNSLWESNFGTRRLEACLGLDCEGETMWLGCDVNVSPCYLPRCHQRSLLAELDVAASGGVCCVSSVAGHGETKRNIYDVTFTALQWSLMTTTFLVRTLFRFAIECVKMIGNHNWVVRQNIGVKKLIKTCIKRLLPML